MKVIFIGLGLIGGSLALALRKQGFATELIGVDASKHHQQQALELGLVDKILPLNEAVQQADLVVVSIPVDSARVLLPQILDLASDNTVVVDMGSTKSGICKETREHPKRKLFVASHPIAGTEYSGPTAAKEDLFYGQKTIVCEREFSADFALQRVLNMYNSINMEVLYMSPEMHDRQIAFVSHLSHITSFALGLTVLDIEKDEKTIFNMAGSGFASTVRLAKSSPQMWAPIFVQNSESISYALGAYIEKLLQFKDCIDNGNVDSLTSLMTEANEIKRIIK